MINMEHLWTKSIPLLKLESIMLPFFQSEGLSTLSRSSVMARLAQSNG